MIVVIDPLTLLQRQQIIKHIIIMKIKQEPYLA
jgi:hypothetical protein